MLTVRGSLASKPSSHNENEDRCIAVSDGSNGMHDNNPIPLTKAFLFDIDWVEEKLEYRDRILLTGLPRKSIAFWECLRKDCPIGLGSGDACASGLTGGDAMLLG